MPDRGRVAPGGWPALGLALAMPAAAHASEASFQPLGDLGGGDDGHFLSEANDVSADGTVAVGESQSVNTDEAFRWTSTGGLVDLDPRSGSATSSRAMGISPDGSVVVGQSNDKAFRWQRSTGMQLLSGLNGSGLSGADSANAVTDTGIAVGAGVDASGVGGEAFRWSPGGGFQGLGHLSGGEPFSEAHDLSADGSVVVGVSESTPGTQAFRWTSAGGMAGLGDLPGGAFFSQANAVSPDGSIVVGTSDASPGPDREAFRWSDETGIQGLGQLAGGFGTRALDVSADGSVVVGRADSPTGDAFLWSEAAGMQNLEAVLGPTLPANWDLRRATAVSRDGLTVVGTGENPSGDLEAFKADITRAAISVLTGDLNGDDEVNNLDINPFVLALTDQAAFEDEFGLDPAAAGDINGDGELNNLDINPFVQLLTAGNTPRPVPSPTSLAPLALGALALLHGRKHRAENRTPNSKNSATISTGELGATSTNGSGRARRRRHSQSAAAGSPPSAGARASASSRTGNSPSRRGLFWTARSRRSFALAP